MICKKCGEFIPDGISICAHCNTVQDVAPDVSSYPYQQSVPQYQPAYMQQYRDNEESMPREGVYLVMVVLGFIMGVIWGILELNSYNKMKNAIAAGRSEEARKNAKSIRTVFIIGVIINIIFIYLYFSLGLGSFAN